MLYFVLNSPKELLVEPSKLEVSEEEVALALQEIKESNVVLDAGRMAAEFVKDAQQSFNKIQEAHSNLDSESRMALIALAEYALERME